MEATQSLYDTPGSLMDYCDRPSGQWQTSSDGMELGLVSKTSDKQGGFDRNSGKTKASGNLLTLGPKYRNLKISANDLDVGHSKHLFGFFFFFFFFFFFGPRGGRLDVWELLPPSRFPSVFSLLGRLWAFQGRPQPSLDLGLPVPLLLYV